MPITLRNTIQKGLIGNEWSTPTIYEDPETGKIVKSYKIIAIGLRETVDKADKDTQLPSLTVIHRVGSAVKEAHHILISDHEHIDPDLFVSAVNLEDITSLFDWAHYVSPWDKSTQPLMTSIPSGLFRNCRNLRTASFAFSRLRNLKEVAGDIFDNCPNLEDVSHMFEGNYDLRDIGPGLFKNCPNIKTFECTFRQCQLSNKSLEGIFGGCREAVNFNYTFASCAFNALPSDLFAGCPKAQHFERTFAACENLRDIPEDLFQNNFEAFDFVGTFFNCRKLRGETPSVEIGGKKYKLWELTGKGDVKAHVKTNGRQCFKGCSAEYGELIPKYWGGYGGTLVEVDYKRQQLQG